MSAVRKPYLVERIILPFLAPLFLVQVILVGLVVNAWQFSCKLFISVFSLSGGHKATSPMLYLLGLNFVWLLSGMGGCTFRVFSNTTRKELEKETNAIMISNHCGSLDWLVIAWMMIKLKKLRTLRSIAKSSLALIPVMGWTWYFAGFIFLKRRMAEDQKSLIQGADRLREASQPGFFGRLPFWLCLFPEGTRSTPSKLKESHDYQVANNIEPMKNLLYPRVKGFIELWKLLGKDSETLVDVTLGYPSDIPAVNKVITGHGSEICVLMKVAKPESVGKDESDYKEFLINAFREKDADLSYYHKNGKFDYPEIFVQDTRFLNVFTMGVVFVSLFTTPFMMYLVLSAQALTIQIAGSLYAVAVIFFLL